MAAAERKEVLNIPLKAMFQAVTDYGAYQEFVTGMKKSKVIGPSADGKGHKAEFELEMIKRVHYSINVAHQMDENSGTATIQWSLDQSEVMKKNNGKWQMKALGPHQTEVVYSLDVEFDFPVPGFILKGLVANSLPTAIKEFSARAAKLKV